MMTNNIRPILKQTTLNKNKKLLKFGCCSAWNWILSIIIVQNILIVCWLTTEFFFFDYRCVIRSNDNPNAKLQYFLNDIRRRAIPLPEIFRGNELNENPSSLEQPYHDQLSFTVDLTMESSSGSNIAKRTLNYAKATTKPHGIHKVRQKHTPIESVVRIEKLPITFGNKSLKTKTTRTRLLENSTQSHKKQYRKKKLFRSHSETIRLAPGGNYRDEDIYGNIIKHPEKRYHLLTGGINTKNNLENENLSDNTNNWLHGVVDPEDPKFFNRGQIRVYPMQVADQRPQPNAEYIQKVLHITDIPTTTTTTVTTTQYVIDPLNISRGGTSLSSSLFENLETVEASILTTTPKIPTYDATTLLGPKTSTINLSSQKKLENGSSTKDSFTYGQLPVQIAVTESTTRTSDLSKSTPLVKIFFDEQLLYEDSKMENSHVASSTPSMIDKASSLTTENRLLTNIPTYTIEKENLDFRQQLEMFASRAMCIIRTVLVLWCLAQVFSAVPYLLGICLKSRWLVIPHLILDALFLLVVFILSITIMAFSLLLYGLVKEMSMDELQEWLAFALVLVAIMVSYSGIFLITLKCTELVLNEHPMLLRGGEQQHHNHNYEPLPLETARQLV